MIIEINNKYEMIYNLHDVVNVIRNYYNKELALELEKLIEEQERKIEGLKSELEYEI